MYSTSYLDDFMRGLYKQSPSVVPKVYNQFQMDMPKERTLLDRAFDVLNVGQYMSAGFAQGIVDDKITPWEGMAQGLVAANPFGKGYEEYEHNYSKVLETSGWQPESTGGKIARGVVGFVGDVMLDPLTYVSGGASGLIKGTGKHSVDAALTGAGKLSKVAFADALGDSAKFMDSISDVSKGVGMTQDVAESIVKNSKIFKSGKYTLDVAEESSKLMTRYNKLLGVNVADSSKTLSLANAPFGKKIFGKHADKSITLIDSDAMKALGDVTFAPMYGKIRDAVYGGKIGELFASSHPLYKISKTNPEQVYNFIKQADLNIGLSIDKNKSEAGIRKAAEMLGNLTPAETKEIMDALEDKTIWSKVKKTVNFIDTKEAQRYKKQIEASKKATEESIINVNNLAERRKLDIEKMNLSAVEKTEELVKIKEDYISELLNINTQHAIDLGKGNEVIEKLLKAEGVIDMTLADDVTELGVKLKKPDNYIDPNDIVKRYRGLADEVNIRNADIETKKMLEETFLTDAKDYTKLNWQMPPEDFKFIEEMPMAEGMRKQYFNDIKDRIRNNGYIEYTRQDYIDKLTGYYPDWEVVKMGDGATRIVPPFNKNVDGIKQVSAVSEDIYSTVKKTSKPELVDDLSTYLFGQKGFIDLSTSEKNLGKIIEKIEEGRSIEEVINYTFNNKELYNGAAAEMYSFIASQVGYDDWYTHYTEPMKKLMDQYHELRKGGKKPHGNALNHINKQIIELEKQNVQRKYFLNMFYGKTSLDDVKDVVLKAKEIEMTRPTMDVINDMLEKGLKGGDLSEEARSVWNLESYMDDFDGGVRRQFHKPDKVAENFSLNKDNKNQAYDFYKRFLKHDGIDDLKKYNDSVITKKTSNLKEIDKYNNQIEKLKKRIVEEVSGIDTVDGDFVSEGHVRTLNNKIKELQSKVTKLASDNSSLDKVAKPKQIAPYTTLQREKQYQNYISKVEEMLQENNVEWNSLSSKQQETYFENAIKKHNTDSLKKNSDEYIEKVAKLEKAQEEVIVLAERKKIVFDSVKPGHKITFLHGSKVREGVVQSIESIDGKRIIMAELDGKLKEVTENIFQARGGRVKAQNLDEIRNFHSQLYDEFVVERENFYNRINDIDKYAADISKEYATKAQAVNKHYTNSTIKIQRETLKLENEIVTTSARFDKNYMDNMEVLQSKIDEYDKVLNNSVAFENYIQTNYNVSQRNIDEVVKKYNPHMGEYILRDDLDMDEKTRNIIQFLRDDLIKMGQSEVDIGKLTNGQFEDLMYEYLPHILTPEGEDFFKEGTEVYKSIQNFGQQYGYGREFNPFRKSRTIKVLPDGVGGFINNPTISQINEYFAPMTKGKNVFSENLADIYLGRALKHNDLMYDNKYMENMLEVFGEDFVGEVKEGFSTVMNYGKLKDYTNDMVKLNTSLDISDAVSRHLKDERVIDMLRMDADMLMQGNPEKYRNRKIKNVVDELLDQYISEYMELNFTDEVRKEIYTNNLSNFLKNTDTGGMLDDVALPMAELNETQWKGLSEAHRNLKDRYFRHINDKMSRGGSTDIGHIKSTLQNALKEPDVDVKKIERIMKRINEFENLSEPQIKNVNDAIVQKANQARKVQLIRDNNDLLAMYDKVTHFIKLNQTAILPAFHARNKTSNIFSNWLEIGYDAIDLNFQKQTMKVMKGELGDDMFEIITKDGSKSKIKWSDLYQSAQDYGAIDSGVFAQDVGVGKSAKGIFNKYLPGKFDPTDTKNFIGYTWGTKVGNVVENHDRFIHFASQVKRGMSFSEAAESVNKFLFDYSDLTMFEQNVMKRIFPYYTWLRKNGQLQLEMMLEKPEKYRMISKVLGGIEGMVDEEDRVDKNYVNDFAKDWIQMPFYVTNPDGRQEPVLWNPNMPFMDVNRIPDPSRPLDSIRDLFTQTNPMIKVPIERMLNRDVFFDTPLIKDGDNKALKRTQHVARQFGAYPVIEGIANKQGLDFGLHMLNQTSGVKLISYDYDKYKAMKISELSKKKENSKSNPGILDSIKRRLGGY